MQPAGNFIAAAAELAAGMQHRQADLHSGASDLMVDAHREAAPVIHDGTAAVLVQRHDNFRTESSQRFIHRVVHDLVDQMVKAALVRGADIHARTLAHRLQPFQHLDLVFVIFSSLLRLSVLQGIDLRDRLQRFSFLVFFLLCQNLLFLVFHRLLL